jgi:HrpA-like RNA helicase
VTVIAGETGSGKTTLVPRFLLEEGYCMRGIIGVTEPRRLAAMSVAEYVASTIDGIGGVVGYQIRHDKKVGPNTYIKYMTEGILLREFLEDEMLSAYEVLVLDEVHERNVNQDLLMALVKRLCRRRPELKVVIMSATIDDAKYAAWFNAPIVRVEGRMYPVEIRYAGRAPRDTVEGIAEAVLGTLRDTEGDTLVFVPDYATIRDSAERLEGPLADAGVGLYSLYGQQTPEDQRAVFERRGKSVIIATNVAETSVTLDGVTMVIDTGEVKEMRFHPEKKMSSLKIVPHSRAGCDQRGGRAGRTRPGTCLRLYDEADHSARRAYTQPEIMRSNLDGVLLQLIAMGFPYRDVSTLEWLSPPRHEDWEAAKGALITLGALDHRGTLTRIGRIMAELPLEPVISRMMLAAADHRCVDAIATIAGSFSTRQVFLRPLGDEEAADEAKTKFIHPRSDFMTLLHAVHAWRRSEEKETFCARMYLNHRALEELELATTEIKDILRGYGIETEDRAEPDTIGKAITTGLLGNLLRRDEAGKYMTDAVKGIRIFPGSALRYRKDVTYAVCAEILETSHTYARNVQEVHPRWLKEIAPHLAPERRKDASHKKKARQQRHGRDRGRRGRR